ncbi:hypothetical protein ACFZCU_25410 [Streptomyces canus]|uniref:hypothetical protein n=1 Tax=Streptomyces canus TaxID=58343 RepID=UPI0036EC5CED
MSWTRGFIALLAVCVVLVTGSVSCGASGAQERKDGQSVSPVGKVLDDTDEEGRHYREVDKDNAPDVGIEVQPNSDDSWSVRLTVENFAFSPAGTKAKAVSGRGVAVVFVDDRPATTLRTPSCRLAAAYVPQGTHKVTARLYADDGTVWAVDGDPVESTADVTASKPRPTGSGAPSPQAGGSAASASESRVAVSAGGASASQAGTRAVGGGSGSRLVTSAVGGASEVWLTTSAVGGASEVWLTTSAVGGASEVRLTLSTAGGAAASRLGTATRAGAREMQAMARVDGGVPYPADGVSADGAVSDARLATSVGGGR